METNMVVLFHARSTCGTWNASSYTSKGRRLRCTDVDGGRFRDPGLGRRYHHHTARMHSSPRCEPAETIGADVYCKSKTRTLHQPRLERAILGIGKTPRNARNRRKYTIIRHALPQETRPNRRSSNMRRRTQQMDLRTPIFMRLLPRSNPNRQSTPPSPKIPPPHGLPHHRLRAPSPTSPPLSNNPSTRVLSLTPRPLPPKSPRSLQRNHPHILRPALPQSREIPPDNRRHGPPPSHHHPPPRYQILQRRSAPSGHGRLLSMHAGAGETER